MVRSTYTNTASTAFSFATSARRLTHPAGKNIDAVSANRFAGPLLIFYALSPGTATKTRAKQDELSMLAQRPLAIGERKFDFDDDSGTSVAVLDQSLEMLLALNGDGKQMLLEAITVVVMSDKTLSVTEAELIRAICASLDCPLPPILVENPIA